MSKYYRTSKIDKKKAIYNIIFGERSNGKTYALLEKALKNYFDNGKQFAYLRRWKEDLTARRASELFSGILANGVIEKLSNGEFTGIYYRNKKFYLCNYDDNKKPVFSDLDIIGYCFSISDGEHDKSTSYPNVNLIIFDEFLTAKTYLPDEFVLFMNTVSTIIRRRTDSTIYMLGNTVNKYSPYFSEMGLTKIQEQKQGEIVVYKYGNSTLSVAVEYCASNNESKAVHAYFAFDNPKLAMITGGAWELNVYPHLPVKYTPSEIRKIFFIEFNDNTYQCNIINKETDYFIYIHIKTTEIKDNRPLVYTLEPSHKRNYNKSVFKPTDKLQSKILMLFKTDKVFYQSNDVGDAISNYLKICGKI
tara:strand:- start:562 stop:1644 length:1083 start_codon:yes stop_codon:yes gene_type:complete